MSLRYTKGAMSVTKEKAIEVIERLPEDASFEDIMNELALCARFERGFREDAEGKLILHDEAFAK